MEASVSPLRTMYMPACGAESVRVRLRWRCRRDRNETLDADPVEPEFTGGKFSVALAVLFPAVPPESALPVSAAGVLSDKAALVLTVLAAPVGLAGPAVGEAAVV